MSQLLDAPPRAADDPRSAPVPPSTERGRPWLRWVVTFAAVALAAAVMRYSVLEGRRLQRDDPEVFLGAAPLVGRNFRDGWDWRFGIGLVGAATVALGFVVVAWRGTWSRWSTRRVIGATALGSMAFAVFLALTDGADGLRYGAEHDTEYLANLAAAPPAGEFVSTFVERIGDYSVHVRGHPPGFVLLLKLLDWIGVGGVWTTVGLSVISVGLVAVGVLVTIHVLAGPQWVGRAAPFLVVAPYAIWMVTSADAVYAALGAVGTAAVAVATWRRGWVSAGVGLAGGLVLGALLFGTYLGAVFLLVPAAVGVHALVRRTPGALPALAGAVVGGAIVTGAFLLAGFWWFDGVEATRDEYWAGSAQFRTWGYFGFANLAAALFAIGPATFFGLLRLRDRRLWIVVGAALAALLAAHLSQYTRAEVERIWLVFYPWLAVAAASAFVLRDERLAIGHRVLARHRAAVWVGVQAASAIALQAALVSKW